MITVHSNASAINIIDRKLIKMIEVFDDLYDAILFLEIRAEESAEEFKAEIFKTLDGRWRVGVSYDNQMELPLG